MKRPRGRRLRQRDERGYIAVVGAALIAFLILPLAAISVDIGRIYVEIERVQNAADAAATAGVTFLPDDFASAKATAIDVARRNGYPNSGTSSVEVSVGEKPTQLKVTVRHTIGNSFGAAFGAGYADVSRAAVADYNGPAPMGSPCNAFGNEPPGTVLRGPTTSVIQAPAGGAECTSNPQLWAAIAGPETPKGNGDQFSTRRCDPTGTDGCVGGVNKEFDPRGYFYLVRVAPSAVGIPITIQVFDPAFVESGDKCEYGPKVVESATYPLTNDMNPYTPSDGLTRYQAGVTNFCSGDVLTTTTSEAPTTSYALRQPTDTYQPVQGVPIASCNKQFPGHLAAKATTKVLREKKQNGTANGNYDASVAQVYRQWVDLCEFTPSQAGDHYLQVRTNVKLGGGPDGQGGYDGNPDVFNQAGDDPTVLGNGSNRFALRVKGAAVGDVSIAGWDHMSIYANYTGATSTFNLVRVVPAAASKILRVTFYDVGDATEAGTIKVLPPINATGIGTPIAGCTGSGVVNGTITNCQLDNVKDTGWNRRTQTIRVPIPNTYDCTVAETGACWFRLQVAFPGAVSDTTTWSARIDGDPVRLIE